MATRVRRATRIGLLVLAGLFVLIQLVPYGRAHTNPPVVQEPEWDRPATRALAMRACFDCHSNETHWPWYSHVAPMSWLVQWDVEEGRRLVNFSEWQRPYEEAGESAETVVSGEMPPRAYVWLHPSARLSAEEKRMLVNGLTATLGTASHHERE